MCEPAAPAGVLEEGVSRISLSPDEPEPGGDDATTQGGRILPPSSSNDTPSLDLSITPPYPSSPGSMSSPLGNGYSYLTPPSSAGGESQTNVPRYNMAPSEKNTASSPSYPRYNPGYGRGQLGNSVLHEEVDMRQPNGIARGNGPGGAVPQYTAAYPTNSSFGGQPPTGPASNSQRNQGGRRYSGHTDNSAIKAKDTMTDSLPKMELWEGKLPTLYARLAVLTPIRF